MITFIRSIDQMSILIESINISHYIHAIVVSPVLLRHMTAAAVFKVVQFVTLTAEPCPGPKK